MGLLTPWHPGYDFSGYTSASAVTIAMEKVHADPKLNANGRIKLRYVGYTITVTTGKCSPMGTVIVAAQKDAYLEIVKPVTFFLSAASMFLNVHL